MQSTASSTAVLLSAEAVSLLSRGGNPTWNPQGTHLKAALISVAAAVASQIPWKAFWVLFLAGIVLRTFLGQFSRLKWVQGLLVGDRQAPLQSLELPLLSSGPAFWIWAAVTGDRACFSLTLFVFST